MIAQTIESDHDAGKEVFAVVGNAAQPAWDERAREMEALARLWMVHGLMLERAIFPRLGLGAGAVEDLLTLNRRVQEMAADLARRGPEHDADGRWLADFETLKAHGFTEEDIWDIAGISAFFGMSNRLANVTNMRPNAEFYSLGR